MYLEYSLLCKAMGRTCSEWSLVATCNKQEFNHSEHVRHVMKCPSILHVMQRSGVLVYCKFAPVNKVHI